MPQDMGLSVGGDVDFRIGAPVMAVIRWGRLHRGVFAGSVRPCIRSVGPARVTRQRRWGRRIGWGHARMGTAVISELDVSGLVSVNMRMSRISLMVGLRGNMKQVIGGGGGQGGLGGGGGGGFPGKGRVGVHALVVT